MAKKGNNVQEQTNPATDAPASAPAPAAAPVAVIKGGDVREIGGVAFKLKKRVTLPTINPAVGEQHVFKILDAFRESTYKAPEGKEEKPATICNVCDLTTGVEAIWIVAEVAKSNIEKEYPNGEYVGLSFAVMKMPKRAGKRYFDWQIAEVEMTPAE